LVVGIGIDIMEIPRVERLLKKATDSFLNRFFTKKEIAYCKKRKRKCENFAAIFAGKEALLKALGIGWQIGVRFVDIEILHDVHGKPMVLVYGKTKEIAYKLNVRNIFIAMSYCDKYAIAQVLLEG